MSKAFGIVLLLVAIFWLAVMLQKKWAINGEDGTKIEHYFSGTKGVTAESYMRELKEKNAGYIFGSAFYSKRQTPTPTPARNYEDR